MNLNIQYVTDTKGFQQAVIIPKKEWIAFEDEYRKIKKKLEILLGIEKALEEVSLIQSGKKKGKSLNEFLNEI